MIMGKGQSQRTEWHPGRAELLALGQRARRNGLAFATRMKGHPEIVCALGRVLSVASFPGKWRLTQSLGNACSRVWKEAECSPAPGVRIPVRLSDRIERLMWAGAYEPELRHRLCRTLRAGMTYLDVGAHIGYFSLLASALVGPTGEVHAFEPDSECFARLCTNATRSSARMFTYQFAVADKVGDVTFHRSPTPGESGWGSLLADREHRQQVAALATTLDAWSEARGIARVGFIKIDAEGAELLVLRGARELLRITRPFVYLEVNGVCLPRGGWKPKDLYQELESLGFAPQPVGKENLFATPH